MEDAISELLLVVPGVCYLHQCEVVGIISISIPLLSQSGKKVAALPTLSGAPLKEGTAGSHTVAKLISYFGTQAKILWYALGQEQFTSKCSPSLEKCQQGQRLASPEYAWLAVVLSELQATREVPSLLSPLFHEVFTNSPPPSSV